MISIVVPVYNEERAIKDTIDRLKKVGPKLGDFEIITVNDGSKDKTLSVLKKIDGIKLISNPYNLGYGASLKKGIREARGEWIAITDADGTYPLEELANLAKHAGEYDMVVGARVGKNVNIPFFRRPAKWIIGKLANWMTGKNIEDVNSGLRIFSKSKALEFMKLYPSGFSFTTTITLAFMTNDYTVKYLPINYYKRVGKSTMGDKPTPKAIKKFIDFITLIFRILMYFRPLRFFLWPAITFIVAGVLYGLYQTIYLPAGLGEFPLLLVVLGVQTLFIGFVADALSKK